MNPFSLFAKRLSILLRRDRFRNELDEEMAFHREQSERNLLACGMSRGMAIYEPMTMEGKIHDAPSTYLHRSSAWIVSGFAVMALMLGVVGLYGVIAYSVSQRTREIGVRMAMGAERNSVYWLVLTEAGQLIVIGVVLGIVMSIPAALLICSSAFVPGMRQLWPPSLSFWPLPQCRPVFSPGDAPLP